MRIRSFECANCGAARDIAEDALVIICSFCGAFVGTNVSALEGQVLADAERMQQRAQQPQTLERRMADVSRQMGEAQSQGDRAVWRVLMAEYYGLLAKLRPGTLPEGMSEGPELAGWLRESLVMTEIMTFDPTVLAVYARFNEKLSALYQSKAGGAGGALRLAREAIPLASAYFAAIQAHPDCTPGSYPEGVEHHGRQLVRSCVEGGKAMIGASTVDQILAKLFDDELLGGDQTHLTCGECGATAARPKEATTVTCASCGAVVYCAEPES